MCHKGRFLEDDFARELVAMGEQTCFLHTLCRTELDVQLSGRAP